MNLSRITLRTLAFLALCLLPATVRADSISLPGDAKLDRVDFERHVMGVLGRSGCSSGSCHGSFQGKGGLQLSLFGYDPAMDFNALTRQASGRRISQTDPDNSLLLLKATGQVPHGGQARFGKNSWAYQILRTWIVQGAEWKPGSGEARSIRAVPSEYVLAKPKEEGQIRIQAEFSDGTAEDITPLCDFRTNDDAVVESLNLGKIRAVRPGDTAVIVSYRGTVLPVRVLVPTVPAPGFKYPSIPEMNYIDHEVFAKLRRLNMVPSDLVGDEEFLRRVHLDTIGQLPTSDEIRTFVADKRVDKRSRKIDELLAHPLHAALWATKFCDITGNNTDMLENPQQRRVALSQMWHDWFRKRVADNMPYDQIVHGVLCATSRDGKSPVDYIKEVEAVEAAQDKGEPTNYAERKSLDLFWRTQQKLTLEVIGEKTAAAFLGVRLECAQCHKHPFDRWTQLDYRSYANVFSPVVFSVSPEARKPFQDATAERNKANMEKQKGGGKKGNQVAPLREVFVSISATGKGANPALTALDSKTPLTPKALGGPEIPLKTDGDPRESLFAWMHAPENPFFARSFANRVWGHYFGQGIVHPVDDFSLANPASNDKLLDALAADFLSHKYDIRALERVILNSRTYQLSSTPNATNRFDRINYAHSYVRPLMAEVVVDVLNDAMGVKEKWAPTDGVRVDARAIEVGASRVQNPTVSFAFRTFGRPPRSTACDCERTAEPALTQKLFLMADTNLYGKLQSSKRISELLAEKKSDDEVLDELFLGTMSRFPTAEERTKFHDFARERKLPTGLTRDSLRGRQAIFTDTLWALMNTSEFIFNH
jgi:Protein of unknown function (DUF1549)/Protein of unknown function (DUF1553)